MVPYIIRFSLMGFDSQSLKIDLMGLITRDEKMTLIPKTAELTAIRTTSLCQTQINGLRT